jgi:hypothetical protein
MSRFETPLNNIRIASPCRADWESMYGNERKRFCGDCKLNVYNLSGMTAREAEDLLRRSEGRLCVRYFRRADGTILTADCPVGWAKARQRVTAFAAAVFAMALTAVGGLFATSAFTRNSEVGKLLPIPLSTPKPTPTPEYEPLMGAIAMPTPTPTPKASPSPKQQPKMGRVIILKPMEDEEIEKAA